MQFEWTQILQYSFQSLWLEVVALAPKLVVALLILILGFIVAGILKKVVRRIFVALRVDEALTAAGVGALTQRAGYRLNAGLFVGTMVKWFVVLVFFLAALEVLQLQQVTSFLSDVVLGYLPKVIVATLIIFASIIVASAARTVVEAAARTAQFKKPELLGRFAKYAILTFAALAVLNQLGIAAEMAQMLFGGLVFGLALAFGLAFGLGGRDAAARTIDSLSKKRE